MQRGYIKFWRKAQDSSSWNRGLMYQGLIINLLSRAAWKKGSYQGRDILPGQFGVVLGLFADSVKVPKTTLHRMVSHLEEDGFLTVENVGHRFSLITIVNWHLYQANGDDAWNADGTPMEYQRNARGTPSYKEEEVKKEEDIRTPLTPHGGDECASAASAPPVSARRTKQPTEYSADFEHFWQLYPRKIGKDAAWKVYQRRKHEIPTGENMAAILARHAQTEQWQREGGKYIPHPATWLNHGRWADDVTPVVGIASRESSPRLEAQKAMEEILRERTPEELERNANAARKAREEWQHKRGMPQGTDRHVSIPA